MNDPVWQSVSAVAQSRGVSKQAVSKRLKTLSGRVSTRQDGPRLLVNVVEYDRAVNAETDPAQALRNRNVAPSGSTPAGGTPGAGAAEREPRAAGGGDLAQRVFSQQRAKRESYEAESARLDLEERMGKLLRVQDVEDALVLCATELIRLVDQLPAQSDDPKLKAILKRFGLEFRQAVAAKMKLLASGDAPVPAEAGGS